MSRYDNSEKDSLSWEMEKFLETHSIKELLEMVIYFMKDEDYKYE